MGEPATPSAKSRAETRELAEAVVESVRADDRMPLGMDAADSVDQMQGKAVRRSDVEGLVFRLAQEVSLLKVERDTWRAAAKTVHRALLESDVGDNWMYASVLDVDNTLIAEMRTEDAIASCPTAREAKP